MKQNISRRAILQSMGLALLAVGCRSVAEPISEVTSTAEVPTATPVPTTRPSLTEPVAPTASITPQSRWNDVLPVQIPERITSIANGLLHAYAITESGSVWGWGYGSAIGLIEGEVILPTHIVELTNIVQASATRDPSSAFLDDQNNIYALNTVFGEELLQLNDLTDVKKVVLVNESAIIALTLSGDVWVKAALGSPIINFDGFRQGTGQFEKLDIDNITDVKTAASSVLFRRSDGTLIVWGKPSADTDSDIYYIPSPYESPANIVDMASGYGVIVALENGAVWQDGYIYDGEFVPNLENIVQLEADKGAARNIALDSEGTIWGWGSLDEHLDPANSGDFFTGYVNDPIKINTSYPIEKIAMYNGSLLALDLNGTVWTWSNSFFRFEEIGIKPPADDEFPMPIVIGNV